MKSSHSSIRNIASALIVPALMVAALPGAHAQSAIDAYNLSQTEMRGTARFMAMSGAFTALGGDLSTLGQNPAGLGVYRGSDIGITLDLNLLSSKTSGNLKGSSVNSTHFDVNNVGYVGTMNFGGDIFQSLTWGFSYGRINSFEREYQGRGAQLQTSMSNYIGLMTDDVNPDKMLFNNGYDGYDPYQDSQIKWLSILAFSGGVINPTQQIDDKGQTRTVYNGLWQYQTNDIKETTGKADFRVRERGYTDEYNIDFGGNLANTVYWGIGVGITDIHRESFTTYVEDLKGANVPINQENVWGIEEGDCDWQIDNWKRTNGTGVNVKFGLILKPINEFRIGFAIHSPTWYSLTTTYNAIISMGASNGFEAQDYTNTAQYDWNMRSPWRLMFGLAGVIGGRGIISADYEYTATNKMSTSSDYYGMSSDDSFDSFNDNIGTYFKGQNTLRLGAELRVTPQFSLRAGYSYSSSNVKNDAADSNLEIYTSGTNLGYTFNQDTNSFSLGAGYRVGGFYVDLAYVYRHRNATYHCFTPFVEYDNYWSYAPVAKLSDNSSQIALTLGYKF